MLYFWVGSTVRFPMIKNYYAYGGVLDVLGRPDYYESDFAKRAVKEIDDSQLISPYNVISPVLGSISTRQLSSGVKMVILLYSVADMTGNGVSMGGNCYPLVFEMAKERDVFIRTPYVDDIPKGQSVSAFCVNNRRIVHTSDEYRKMCAYYSCDDFDEEDEYCRKWAARIPVR